MRTRQVRPDKLDFEYELLITKEHDSIVNKDYILFHFRTKKVFESFEYIINILPEIDIVKKKLLFNIEGLSAPKIDISKSGNAGYSYKFFDFKNAEYELDLLKYAKGRIQYKFKISPAGIKITKEPESSFIKVFTEED